MLHFCHCPGVALKLVTMVGPVRGQAEICPGDMWACHPQSHEVGLVGVGALSGASVSSSSRPPNSDYTLWHGCALDMYSRWVHAVDAVPLRSACL